MLLFLAWATLAAPVVAQAQVDEDIAAKVEEHNRRGIQYYKAGKLVSAVEEMFLAYELLPTANILYNIGRIYQKMKEFELSVEYFKKYVDTQNTDPAHAKKAKKAKKIMAKLRKKIRRKASKKSAANITKPALEELVNPPVPPNDTSSSAETRFSPSPATDPEPAPDNTPISPKSIGVETSPETAIGAFLSRVPLGAWALGGTGIAMTMAGVGFEVMAGQTFADFKSATTTQAKKDKRKETDTYALGTAVGFGVGGALILGGIIWAILDIDPQKNVAHIGPWLSPEHYGAWVRVPLP
jgi:hypothetical protein